jgi:hypothetical protein
VARAEGVAGDAVVVSDVVGAQLRVWVARVVAKLILDELTDA